MQPTHISTPFVPDRNRHRLTPNKIYKIVERESDNLVYIINDLGEKQNAFIESCAYLDNESWTIHTIDTSPKTNTMQNMRIQVTSGTKQDTFALLSLAKGLGVTFRETQDHDSPETYANQYGDTCTNLEFSLCQQTNQYRFDGGNYKSSKADFHFPEDITKIVAALSDYQAPVKIKIKDVGDYEAVVSSNGVQVGCQTISFDKVKEIAKAIEEVEKSLQ